MKYSMVAINVKNDLVDDEEAVRVRRALIAYEGKTAPVFGSMSYKGTRFVTADPYFSEKGKSHVYQFSDDGYSLISTEDDGDAVLKGKKRAYHCYIPEALGDMQYLAAVEFEADSDAKAIEAFDARKELR
jgi:hypothetical protein